jgi:HK97 family phage prohead protease
MNIKDLSAKEIVDQKIKLHMNSFSTEKGFIDKGNLTIRGVVGSSGIIDRHGESISPDGWELKNYRSNPVILYGHNYEGLPIGQATKVYKQDGKLLFDIKFSDKSFAKDVFDLFAGGFLRAFSVGFIPLELDNKGDYTYSKQELLELSAVTVPANPEAVAPEIKSKLAELDERAKKELEVTQNITVSEALLRKIIGKDC